MRELFRHRVLINIHPISLPSLSIQYHSLKAFVKTKSKRMRTPTRICIARTTILVKKQLLNSHLAPDTQVSWMIQGKTLGPEITKTQRRITQPKTNPINLAHPRGFPNLNYPSLELQISTHQSP